MRNGNYLTQWLCLVLFPDNHTFQVLLKNGKHDLTLVGLPISMQDLYLVRISNENAQQPEHHKFD